MTYAFAAVLQRAGPLLLLPLFARILEPGEFGQIGVILTLSSAVATVAGFGLETAVFRGYAQRKDDPGAAASFVNSAGAFGVIAPTIVALAIAGMTAPIATQVFGVPLLPYVVGVAAAALTASAAAVPLAVLRAEENLRLYLQLTWIQIALSTSLLILFVVGFNGGSGAGC